MEIVCGRCVAFCFLFTDVMLMACCLNFTVMVGRMERVQPNLLFWCAICAAAYLWNRRLCHKKSSMASVFASNVIWMAATAAAACFCFQTEPRSIMMKVVLGIALIAIQGHGCYLAYYGAKAEQALVLFDAGIVVAAIFFYGCERSAIPEHAIMQLFCFVMLAWLLIVIVCLRTGMGQLLADSSGQGGKRIGIFILLGGLFAICGGTCTALMLKLNGVLYSLRTLSYLFWQQAKAALFRFQTWLQGLAGQMPDDGTAGAAPDLASGSAGAGDGAEGIPRPPIPGWFTLALGIAVLAAIVVLVILILRRLQNEKASVEVMDAQQAEIVRTMTGNKKKTSWQHFKYRLALHFLWMQKKESAEGLAILLRRRGKKSGIIMQPCETWQTYARHLSDHMKEKAAGTDGKKRTAWEEKAEGLNELAFFFERYFYSHDPCSLSKKQYLYYKKILHW